MTQQNSPAPINQLVSYLVLLLGVLLFAYTVVGSLGSFGAVNDLPEYYVAARMVASGTAPAIYDLPTFFSMQKHIFPSLTRGVALFVPPPAVPLLLPLALLPPTVAPLAWTNILVVALVCALLLLARWQRLTRQNTLWLFGIVLLSGPAVESVRIGQLAPLMLLGLTAFGYFAQGRPGLAGVLLDTLVFKPQQLFPLGLFLVAGMKRRIVLFAAAFALILCAISQVVFGAQGMAKYIETVTNPANLQLMQPALNPTVRGQMLRIVGPESGSASLVAGIALLLSAAFIAWVSWRHRQCKNWLSLSLGGLLPLGLLTSLHCHDYDLLLLVPGFVCVLKSQLWARLPAWAKIVAMLGISAYLLPFYNDVHYSYLLKGGVLNPHFIVLLVFATYLAHRAAVAPGDFEAASDATAASSD